MMLMAVMLIGQMCVVVFDRLVRMLMAVFA